VSPVVGISMIWIYGVGYVVGGVMALFNIQVLYRLFTGKLREEELVQVIESEDLPHSELPVEDGLLKDGARP
jgi:TRAP-type C4-dicarboxylate transport system permease small subunit